MPALELIRREEINNEEEIMVCNHYLFTGYMIPDDEECCDQCCKMCSQYRKKLLQGRRQGRRQMKGRD